jgi:hypothetical protein
MECFKRKILKKNEFNQNVLWLEICLLSLFAHSLLLLFLEDSRLS